MNRLRIRHGDNEIEIEGSVKYIQKQLESFYQRIQAPLPFATPITLKREIQAATGKKTAGKEPSPAEYYKSKNQTDGVSQILILGKYLEEFRGKSEFTPKEINKLGTEEIRLSKDIHPQYFTNAVKQGLLRSIGGGRYTLTLSAEEVLAAMK
jgi:hypothetical protein